MEKAKVFFTKNIIPEGLKRIYEYLSQFDYSDLKIFEYGCGYSSAFWAERAKKVVSVEDKTDWFEKWKRHVGYKEIIKSQINTAYTLKRRLYEKN